MPARESRAASLRASEAGPAMRTRVALCAGLAMPIPPNDGALIPQSRLHSYTITGRAPRRPVPTFARISSGRVNAGKR
ncbi:MAG: hypothetical protein NVSMB23_24810 [Myxococcales bacterium]